MPEHAHQGALLVCLLLQTYREACHAQRVGIAQQYRSGTPHVTGDMACHSPEHSGWSAICGGQLHHSGGHVQQLCTAARLVRATHEHPQLLGICIVPAGENLPVTTHDLNRMHDWAQRQTEWVKLYFR